MVVLRFFAVTSLVVLSSVATVGGTSGLNVMPTTDSLGPGDFTSILSSFGASENYQIGLAPGLELGYDSADGESRVWNAKLPIAFREADPAVSVGVINVGKGSESQAYVVGNAAVGSGRMHFGAIKSAGILRPMAGYDRQISERLTIMADYIAGSENCAGLGFSMALGEDSGITISALRNNSGSRPYGFSVTLNQTISIGQILGIKSKN